MFPVAIRDMPRRRVVGVPHTGPYHEIAQAFEKLGQILGESGVMGQARAMLAIYDHEPGVPDSEKYSMAAAELPDEVACPAGLTESGLDAGRYAVVEFTGPYNGLGAAYEYLTGEWLAGSGQRIRRAPFFEIYRNNPGEVPPEDLRTDIYMPIQPK